MLLSDDEEWKLWNEQGIDDMNQAEAIAFARAYAAAILAKLGSAELPEPAYTIADNGRLFTHPEEEDQTGLSLLVFTADQLRQAYAQGAAAQLADKPTAWMYPHRLGHRELTFTDQAPIELAHPHFAKSTPLYTRREA